MVESYKQPFEWVNVAARVSQMLGRDNVRFIWVGGGTLLDAAQLYAQSLSSIAEIDFVGSHSNPDDYYRSSHLYFQYSSIENMSLAVIDALRHGLPSVVTDVGGLPEIIQDAKTGLITSPLDDEAAATAIASILSGEKDLQIWGIDAKRQYRLEFSQSQWESRMIDLHVAEDS